MWILTCDTDLLNGKALWLQPSSRHLLGRTSPNKSDHGAQVRYIDHKTISRQHLIIKVDAVSPGDSAHFLSRSKITLIDNSKAGTTINGTSISKTEKALDKTENIIRLGASQHIFHIDWKPRILTFTNIPKALKASRDALATYREKLEQTDIKLVTEYINNHTTHVVASKRNTTACLQALAQAKWMVSYTFIDAIIDIIQSRGQDEHGDAIPSALVEDFDAHWPSEKQHPVAAGTEPVQRPDELMLPNAQRCDIFDGLSFIFMFASQYENLMAPITACGGKAILQEPEPTVTTAKDYMNTILSIVKPKKGRTVAQQYENIIIVRPGEPVAHTGWWTQFNTGVQLTSKRRSIMQGELLDAIVMLDTTTLQQPLHEEVQDQQSQNDSAKLPPSQALATTAEQRIPKHADKSSETSDETTTSSTKPTKRERRMPARSIFKGLDEFDPSQITHAPPEEEPSQIPNSLGDAVDNDVVDSNTLKRTAAQRDESSLTLDLEAELRGMAAMKKRKLNNSRQQQSSTEQIQRSDEDSISLERQEQKKLDVRAKIKAHRAEAEEERKRDEQALQDQLGGMDIRDIRSQVELFEVKLPDPKDRQQQSQIARRAGWDPKWDGRPNFKAFRPQGQRTSNNGRQSVMVALVEVPKKGFGLGEDYWLSDSRSTSQNRNSHSTSDGQSNGITARSGSSAQYASGNTSVVEDSLQQVSASRSQARPGKRAAMDEASGIAKRPRPPRFDDDDDEDGLRFRRKRL